MSFKVYINQGEWDQICDWVLKHQDIETGGDLFGLWLDEQTAVVQFVLGPGIKCKRTTTSFFQDVDYLGEAGTYLTKQHGLCNVGQWHSHHKINLFKPSMGDENTVWSNMPNLGLDRYIVFIANISNEVTINCFLFQIKKGKKLPVKHGKFKPLPGNSPMRLNEKILQNVHIGAESFNEITKFEEEMKYIRNKDVMENRDNSNKNKHETSRLENGVQHVEGGTTKGRYPQQYNDLPPYDQSNKVEHSDNGARDESTLSRILSPSSLKPEDNRTATNGRGGKNDDNFQNNHEHQRKRPMHVNENISQNVHNKAERSNNKRIKISTEKETECMQNKDAGKNLDIPSKNEYETSKLENGVQHVEGRTTKSSYPQKYNDPPPYDQSNGVRVTERSNNGARDESTLSRTLSPSSLKPEDNRTSTNSRSGKNDDNFQNNHEHQRKRPMHVNKNISQNVHNKAERSNNKRTKISNDKETKYMRNEDARKNLDISSKNETSSYTWDRTQSALGVSVTQQQDTTSKTTTSYATFQNASQPIGHEERFNPNHIPTAKPPHDNKEQLRNTAKGNTTSSAQQKIAVVTVTSFEIVHDRKTVAVETRSDQLKPNMTSSVLLNSNNWKQNQMSDDDTQSHIHHNTNKENMTLATHGTDQAFCSDENGHFNSAESKLRAEQTGHGPLTRNTFEVRKRHVARQVTSINQEKNRAISNQESTLSLNQRKNLDNVSTETRKATSASPKCVKATVTYKGCTEIAINPETNRFSYYDNVRTTEPTDTPMDIDETEHDVNRDEMLSGTITEKSASDEQVVLDDEQVVADDEQVVLDDEQVVADDETSFCGLCKKKRKKKL